VPTNRRTTHAVTGHRELSHRSRSNITCHSPTGSSSGGQTAGYLRMQGLLANVIAVVVTLVGAIVPYVFQRMNARHVERFARDERLSQERRPWGSGEGGDSGAVVVGGDQVGDVALIEAVVQALRTLHALSRAHTGLLRAAVWQSRRSAACVECE